MTDPDEPLKQTPGPDQDEQPVRSDRWRKLLIRSVALVLLLAFIPFIFSGFLHLFGLPSFGLLVESIGRSRDPRYARLCQAVVAVQAENRQGTGFIIEPQGLIVTNAHVVQGAGQVLVGFETKTLFPAKTWQQWPAADVALIQADLSAKPFSSSRSSRPDNTQPNELAIGLELESTGKLPEVGEQVTVIGNPLGLFQIVSQAEFVGQTFLSNHEGAVLVISGPIFRGNSGSPVINAEGKVIGVLFATASGNASNAKNSTAYVITAAEILAKLDLFQP